MTSPDEAQAGGGGHAEEVGRRIAKARLEAGGMTQEELSDLVGVTKRSVQLWEAGESIPYRHMPKLEGVLRRSTAWLLYGDEGVESPDAGLERLERGLQELRDLSAYRNDQVQAKLDHLAESLREVSRQVADIRERVEK